MLPDIEGRDVAAFWYKTMRNYYFLKDPAVLHVYACKQTEKALYY